MLAIAYPSFRLFSTTCAAWHKSITPKAHAIGLHLLVVDGTIFRVQDSSENRDAFSFISKSHQPYPQLRIVSLNSTHTKTLLGAAFYSCYFSANLLLNWQQFGVNSDWLTPAKKGMRSEVIERDTDNHLLIEMPVSLQARRKNSTLPATWQAKMICYQHPKNEIKGFVTSLVDSKMYPMEELLSIYWER